MESKAARLRYGMPVFASVLSASDPITDLAVNHVHVVSQRFHCEGVSLQSHPMERITKNDVLALLACS